MEEDEEDGGEEYVLIIKYIYRRKKNKDRRSMSSKMRMRRMIDNININPRNTNKVHTIGRVERVLILVQRTILLRVIPTR